MGNLNFLEKIALRVLRRRIDRDVSRIREWSQEDLARIERTEMWTKIAAAAAGALCGAFLGGIEIWIGETALDITTIGAWRDQLSSWMIYLFLAILISGGEVLFLYGCALRAAARISAVAGISLSPREVEELIARGLARAALEIPNPREPIYGIDPYSRVPRWKLIAYAIVYRLKVGVTSFLVRVLLRRVLARSAFRVLIPLAALPVFAIWNALIARWVMREIRIRVAGPLVVQQIGERLAAVGKGLEARARRTLIEAAGEIVLRGEDAHPNYVLLFERMFRALPLDGEPIRPDWERTRRALAELSPEAWRLALTILVAAAVLNSALRRAQRELLGEAFAACGLQLHDDALLSLRRDVLNGRGITADRLRVLLGEAPPEGAPANAPGCASLAVQADERGD